jgi:hypothetical protein
MFHPQSTGSPAYGITDSGGKYYLMTGNEAGLPAGEYLATVSAREASTQEYGPGGSPPPAGKSITPAKYQQKETSGLTFTVNRGKNEFNIELSSSTQ